MLIFFVRHGLTDWNAQRRFQGTCDIPLNEDESRRLQLSAKTISDYINTLDISTSSLVL